MLIRKRMLIRDRTETETDEMGASCAPLTRVAALAVLRNPFAGVEQGDLTALFEYGATPGAQLATEALAALGAPSVIYRKAAIVGAHGAAEHGAALLHPRLGKPVGAAIGGGQALMPSTVKLGGLGCFIDLPLGHKDKAWSFDRIDTLSIAFPDAPCPNEIVVCVGMSDRERPRARVGRDQAREVVVQFHQPKKPLERSRNPLRHQAHGNFGPGMMRRGHQRSGREAAGCRRNISLSECPEAAIR